MKKKARLAVVGTGWWATYTHIPAALAHEAAELVAICDQNSRKVGETGRAFGLERTYTDVETMLDRELLDGVIVATHHAAHFEVARRCLADGLHLLIEKPMTLAAAEARELVAEAGRQGREIVIGYNANFTPYAQRAREVIASGRLGEVQYISGVFNQHNLDLLSGRDVRIPQQPPVQRPGAVYSDPKLSGGGHGHLQITHLAGLLFYLTGLAPRTVGARMSSHGLQVDLVTAMTIEFESGALAAIGGTSNMPGGRKIDLQIYCQHGWVDIDDVAGEGRIGGDSIEEEVIAFGQGQRRPEDRFASTYNLVEIILGRGPNCAPGEVGWRAVELLDAAYRSAGDGGRPVPVADLYR